MNQMLVMCQITEVGRSDHGTNEMKLYNSGSGQTITIDGVSEAFVKFAAAHLYAPVELKIELAIV